MLKCGLQGTNFRKKSRPVGQWKGERKTERRGDLPKKGRGGWERRVTIKMEQSVSKREPNECMQHSQGGSLDFN